MKSKQELIARALAKLGVPGAGQTASAEDTALVDAVVEPTMSDLATRDIWVWGNPDEYDEDAFEHLAGILANAVAEDFGKAFDPGKQEYLEGRLRGLKQTMLSGQSQRVEYY